jgi:hypothetical protein
VTQAPGGAEESNERRTSNMAACHDGAVVTVDLSYCSEGAAYSALAAVQPEAVTPGFIAAAHRGIGGQMTARFGL